MIRSFALENRRLVPADDRLESAVWLDLVSPTSDEERTTKRIVGVDVPTRADMEEIEISSRLYVEDGAAYMTAILPARADRDDPDLAPVSFVLTGNRLVTVRFHEPTAFTAFPARASKTGIELHNAETLLVSLLEAIVDRLADLLERAGRDIEGISREIFHRKDAVSHDTGKILNEIGRKGEFTSYVRDSLLTLERLIGFLGHITVQRNNPKELRDRVETLGRDARSLLDHAGFLSQKINFLLDAMLGMINIEQAGIIKIFSVAAVIFLPPTLVASIYGMNFDHMPELHWLFGYPFALGLMVLSAVVPYLYFKRHGWL